MSTLPLFKWRHFQADIILLNVQWYCRYALSYRDLEEMMQERGVEVDHSTINRWVLKYAPELDKRIRPHLQLTNDSWRVDETYMKAECRRGNLPPPNLLVKGAWKYLYRAVDSASNTLDFMLSAKRDAQAAERFLRKILNATHTQTPRVINRFYEKSVDGATKNDHFRAMLETAKQRGFTPECVVFDSWYSSLDNLKLIRRYGWIWLTRLKRNRHVNLDNTGNRPVAEVEIAVTGTVVHWKGYGLVKVFKIVTPDGDIDYWVTNDLNLSQLRRLQLADLAWTIEEYHRGLKQCCGVERAQVRSSRAQRHHIGLAIRAFLRLELHWFATGISWYEAKLAIVRNAIRAYLAAPSFVLTSTA